MVPIGKGVKLIVGSYLHKSVTQVVAKGLIAPCKWVSCFKKSCDYHPQVNDISFKKRSPPEPGRTNILNNGQYPISSGTN